MAAGTPVVTVFTVTPDEAGLRVDAFLVRRSVAVSAAAARRMLAQTGARIDGRRGRKGERLEAGQRVELLPAPAAPTPGAPMPALVLVHVDEALVAMVKPAGVACHPLRDGETGTLADALLARFPECAAAGQDPREAGFAHRLDVGTSGVIVAARRPDVYVALRQTLGEGGQSEKQYLAEVVGALPPGPGGVVVVDLPIGRLGRRGARVIVGGGRGAMPARTEFRARAVGQGTSLVEARLGAGRAHQVRAHLAHLGTPILGDRLYGDGTAAALATARGVEGFRLHAWRLRLRHPVTGALLILEAPPPAWATPAARQEPEESR
jgi:23S rRNA pseudouridine1911/1915/1917 synthase